MMETLTNIVNTIANLGFIWLVADTFKLTREFFASPGAT
jgi:hypothetical protein